MNPNAAIASVSLQLLKRGDGNSTHRICEQDMYSFLNVCVVVAPVANHRIHKTAMKER